MSTPLSISRVEHPNRCVDLNYITDTLISTPWRETQCCDPTPDLMAGGADIRPNCWICFRAYIYLRFKHSTLGYLSRTVSYMWCRSCFLFLFYLFKKDVLECGGGDGTY